MPKGSEELTKAREDEIVNACAELYETKSFGEITIRDIGDVTTFSRTSIYNYFQTKEEIFLALLRREYESWAAYFENIMMQRQSMSRKEFAECVAYSLCERETMLKLLSMNLYEMETNSSLQQLVRFKEAYYAIRETLGVCLHKYFPDMTEDDIERFENTFFPFLFGVYPSTSVTEIQLKATEALGIENSPSTVFEITYSCVLSLLSAMCAGTGTKSE